MSYKFAQEYIFVQEVKNFPSLRRRGCSTFGTKIETNPGLGIANYFLALVTPSLNNGNKRDLGTKWNERCRASCAKSLESHRVSQFVTKIPKFCGRHIWMAPKPHDPLLNTDELQGCPRSSAPLISSMPLSLTSHALSSPSLSSPLQSCAKAILPSSKDCPQNVPPHTQKHTITQCFRQILAGSLHHSVFHPSLPPSPIFFKRKGAFTHGLWARQLSLPLMQ